MSVRQTLRLALAAAACGLVPMAGIRAEGVERKLEADYWGGVALEGGHAALSRFTLKATAWLQFGDHWNAELALRAEHASDRTGLGSLDTYASASRPLLDDARSRLEIDRATLTRRAGATVLTLGKQVVPWGVLDGVQVTDRFDAVRRRDFVLTDIRPERIGRWGARLRTELHGVGIDAAVLVDPTVSQLARRGDAFEPLAPRLRGGLPGDAPVPPVRVDERDDYADDLTAGIRLSRRFGELQATLLTLRGPDTDPVFALAAGSGGPFVQLDYPRRTVHGATLEGPAGNAVWRLEVAYLPDQPVNLRGAAPLARADRRRWLAGVGLDWNAPGGWFVNAQLAVDQVERAEAGLVRPEQDVIGTLRVQRGFRQETLRLRAELLGTLSDGDGVLRPVFEWLATDQLALAVGADLLFGARDTLFGQYRDASRVWVRSTLSL